MRGFLLGIVVGAGAALAALHYFEFIDLNELTAGQPQAELLTFENPKAACDGDQDCSAVKWSEAEETDEDGAE